MPTNDQVMLLLLVWLALAASESAITLQVAIFSAKSIRHISIRIALCYACELSSRDMFAVDHRSTLAKALSSFHLFCPH